VFLFRFQRPQRFASFSVVLRKPFIQAYSPMALAQLGLPPNSLVTNVPKAYPDVRAITVHPKRIVMDSVGRTVRIISTPQPVTTLPRLVKLVNDPSWIAETAAGRFTISVALIIDRNASMTVGGSAVRTVRLLDVPSVMIGTKAGKLSFKGVTVEAVPSLRKIERDSFYRPFVAATAGAKMNVTNSTFIGLGWDWNASYGASWEDGSTGSVVGSTFEDGFIGAYTGQSGNILFRDDVFRGNSLYGLDPHTYSFALVIENVIAEGNRAHGIIFSNHVTNSIVSHSISRDNGENGIMMDLHSIDNRILDNTVYGNTGDGLVTSSSPYNYFAHNLVYDNRVGVRLSVGDGQHTTILSNRVIDNAVTGQNVQLSRSNSTADNGGQWDKPVVEVIWSTVAGLIVVAAIVLAISDLIKQRRQRNELVVVILTKT
jgi:poly(beta-D-mannuronate) C5 epimerase